MNKHHGTVTSKDNIRAAWQFFRVKSKPKTHRMEKSSHHDFGLRVLRRDASHECRSLLLRKKIDHVNARP